MPVVGFSLVPLCHPMSHSLSSSGLSYSFLLIPDAVSSPRRRIVAFVSILALVNKMETEIC